LRFSKPGCSPRRAETGRRLTVFLALPLLAAIALSAFRQTVVSPGVRALFAYAGDAASARLWIYFKDKGPASASERDEALALARRDLNARCAWRRGKVRDQARLVDEADLALSPAYLKKVGGQVTKVRALSRWLNAASVEATGRQLRALEQNAFIRSIDLVASFKRDESLPSAAATSSPARAFEQDIRTDYGPSHAQLEQIGVPTLHDLGYSGRGVIVGMLDTGFRKSHQAFRNARLLAEWDFVNGDGDVQQDLSDPNDYSDAHGTGTWSVLGGFSPGQLFGPAYGADFLLAKTETVSFERPIEEDYWVAGIEWAESLGAEVVSSSLGYTDWYTFADMDGRTAVTTRAANRAVSLGVVVVNAAGNERDEPWGHIIAPADGFGVVAVGAVNAGGRIAPFSSPGPTFDGRTKPEVCALGVDDWMARNGADGSDTYGRASGTSFATPLVAGAVALILEAHRDWTPLRVRSALLGTAGHNLRPDNNYGWGIIDAASAALADSRRNRDPIRLKKRQERLRLPSTAGESRD
jgi:serine protease AprX